MNLFSYIKKNKLKIKRNFFQILIFVASVLCLIYADDKIKVLLVTFFAIYFFVQEVFPSHVTALIVMIVLMIFGLVSPEEGVSGFSSSATITVLAIFILSTAVQKTGAVYKLNKIVFKFAGKSEIRQLLIISLIIGPVSGFINNTAAVAIMLPMVMDLARRSDTSATKLLIPLSFLSMAGGMLTLLGTSTSILANSILETYPEIAPLEIFDITNLGAIVLLITIIYFLFIGRFLLPNREDKKNDEEKDEKIKQSQFMTEVEVQAESRLIGKTLAESKFLQNNDLEVEKIIRNDQNFQNNVMDEVIKEGDIIVLFGDEQRIIDLDKNLKDNVKILLNFDSSRNMPIQAGKIFKVLTKSPMFMNLPISSGTHSWQEFGSTFLGKIFKTEDDMDNLSNFDRNFLKKKKILQRYNTSIVGVHCEKVINKRLANSRIETGEILLVKSSEKGFHQIKKSNDFVILEVLEEEFNQEKMWMALFITIGVVVLSALGIFPIMVAALLGMILMILTKCLSAEDMGEAVSWDVIFLLAGIIPLGIAMEKSGTAQMLADLIVNVSDFLPHIALLGLFYLITTIITTVISNNASVILLVPIAISVAQTLGLNPMSFVLVVMFAASTSFLSPVGYQTNAMVFGAGNYKFIDFFKVGILLNIILGVVTTIFIVKFWGL